MKRSNRLILLIGVFLAALAFVFIIILLQPSTSPNQPGSSAAPAKVATIVAAKDIPLGVAITSDMLTVKQLDPGVRLPGVFGDVTQAAGQVARANIKKDQQITIAVTSDTGTSTHVDCPAGFTCIAVQVDQVSGVGTLIKTGDYVDLVAQLSTTAGFPTNYFVGSGSTTPVSGDAGAKYDPASVKMLLQGLQVVATLLPPPPAPEAAAAGATPAPATGGGGATALNGQQEIVIIAVTTQQAEVVKFAQVDGNITLSLRSPKDFVDENNVPIIPPTVDTTGMTLQKAITDLGVLVPLPVVIPAPAPAR